MPELSGEATRTAEVTAGKDRCRCPCATHVDAPHRGSMFIAGNALTLLPVCICDKAG